MRSGPEARPGYRRSAAQSLVGGVCVAMALVGSASYAANIVADDRLPARTIAAPAIALSTGVLAVLAGQRWRARCLLTMLSCGFALLGAGHTLSVPQLSQVALGLLTVALVYAVPAWPEAKIVIRQGSSWSLVERQEHHAGLIAGELHDEVLQFLALARRRLDAARAETDPHRLRAAMEEASRTLDEQTAVLRGIIATVSPVALRGLSLAEMITSRAERVAAENGLIVDVDVRDERFHASTAENGVNLAVYRVVQESLNNIVKHAGARHVTVSLTCRNDRITVTVTDDGRGLPQPARRAEGYGMKGMRWRCEAYGGTFRAASADTGGTTVRADFPLRCCRRAARHRAPAAG
ncbi:sensor histidine kinase [Streptomyces luteireticuli]|uniref:histidine kinase n=1 Tax=Streptomyces luteireticuli TaxID=173858 RepID=A0ABN0Y8K5_9ACTN